MLVVGLGNTILGDDGAGIYTVRRLRTLLAADGATPPVDFAEYSAGPAAAAQLRHLLATAIDFAECSAGGLELLELMLGHRRVIIVDAWPVNVPWPSGTARTCSTARPGDSVVPHPGELRVFDLQALVGTPAAASLHQVGLPGAMELAHHLGLSLPDKVEVWAIAAADIGFREGCTPAVARAVEATAKRLAHHLLRTVFAPHPSPTDNS